MPRTPGQVYWFTGLSGSGKSTVAQGVKARLEEDGISVLVLDGDKIRSRINKHLGFSEDEIKRNNASVVALCREQRNDYRIVLVPIISPYAASRRAARNELNPGFYEIHLKADLATVRGRDVKGLYAKAMNGEIENMIGFHDQAPYEPPEKPDLVLDTAVETPDVSVRRLYEFISANLAS